MENCNFGVLKLAEDFPVLVEASIPWHSAGVGRARKKSRPVVWDKKIFLQGIEERDYHTFLGSLPYPNIKLQQNDG